MIGVTWLKSFHFMNTVPNAHANAESSSATAPTNVASPSSAGDASTAVPPNPTTRPSSPRRLMRVASSRSESTAVNSGIVLDISDANPAGTLLTPNTSSALDTVVILNPTTKIRPQDRPVGRESFAALRSARPTRNDPPITVRIEASSIGPVWSKANLRAEKLPPISIATTTTATSTIVGVAV